MLVGDETGILVGNFVGSVVACVGVKLGCHDAAVGSEVGKNVGSEVGLAQMATSAEVQDGIAETHVKLPQQEYSLKLQAAQDSEYKSEG